jgi:hypothetical protein
VTIQRLEELLAERILGWRTAPDRFLMDGRRWIPRWRFQPTTRLKDASRLLDAAAPDEYMVGAENGTFWAKVRIAGTTGEAHESSQARAITLAVARAIGLDVSTCE